MNFDKALGKHALVEYYGYDPLRIDDRQTVRAALLEGARMAGATVVTDTFHKFSPYGLSGVVVLAESHIAIHSWPEHRCASVDIFSCSALLRIETIINHLKEVFAATHLESTQLLRGRIPPANFA